MSNRGFFAGSTIKAAPPPRTLPQCGACGLFEKCKTPKMKVGGNGACRILFVGEAPHLEEDENGRHFVGKSGQRLRSVLKSLQFNLDADGWSTNAIICRPHRAGGQPTALEVDYCRPNIIAAIKELKPNVIVPMGVHAVNAVVGSIWGEGDIGPMDRWAGWRIPCQALNAWVCPTWHPAHVMHTDDPVIERQFKEHLRYAVGCDAAPWPDGVPQWPQDVVKMHDPDKAADWLRKCTTTQRGAIAWDYETNMLKPDGPDARIVSCAVAWGRGDVPERVIAYPWHGAAIAATGELLRSPIPKMASNLKFEDRWTRRAFGHRVRDWAWDTMLAAHVLDNRQAITSVKFQGFVRLGVPVWNDRVEPFLKSGKNETVNAIYREIDIDDLLQYNGMDALIEFRVATHQMKELGFKIPWEV